MFKTLKLPVGGEIGIVIMIVAIISLMILPLPTQVLDLLLAINIAISVTLLMITLYVPSIVSLSAFPSLLLFTTLYRLSLNIASTKLILLHAEAGAIIDSFGELVVGGNLVVGLVVFVIIATVQFIVIAKGSERVAEVGARFTLDAMPGKQMSIDADLRSGLLTPDEARTKRASLAIESQLHGGMDGAMKFVKGDAIAGLIITLVNIVAGIAVGVVYHGMKAGEAANRFSVLSVGDAMVSQIPSLLLSVAAGVMITRVSDERNPKDASLGAQIGSQVSGSPRALIFAAVLLVGFSFVPGFPMALFLGLAAVLVFAGYRLARTAHRASGGDRGELSALMKAGAKGEGMPVKDHAPALACAFGMRLAPDLMQRLSYHALGVACESARLRLQSALGLPFPGIVIWTDATLAASRCEMLIHDVPQFAFSLPADMTAEPDPMVVEITRNQVALPERRAGASRRPEDLLADVAAALLERHASLFLGMQEVQFLLDELGRDYPTIVAEVQKVMPSQRMADVLRRLLEERIPIRDLRSIMESLIVWAPKEKDLLMLAEYVRIDLARLIAYRATHGSGRLRAVLLDTAVEQQIRQSIKQTPTGNFLALAPDDANALLEAIDGIVSEQERNGLAVVTSMDIRRYTRRLIEKRFPWLPVHSYQELSANVEIEPVGRLG